jgi:hypothetical protein
MSPTRIQTKPSVQRDMLLSHLRESIVRGSLAPGAQLPARAELKQQFQIANSTIQAAFDCLIRDGFVRTRGPKGSFVVEQPPHLYDYGLVFPGAMSDPQHWGHFWRALLNESADPQRWRPRRLRAYRGVDSAADNETYAQLQSDVRAHRLAGLIFTSTPWPVHGTRLMEEAAIPMVAFMAPHPSFPSVHALHGDGEGMIKLALDVLEADGRKRVAMFGLAEYTRERSHWERFLTAAARRGMEVRPYWAQLVSGSFPSCAREVAQLLMQPSQPDRPDGIFVTDDNFLEHVTAGVADAGVRAPRDVTIVSHCNFPWPTPSALPVRRVGFDVREILRIGMEAIDRMRLGQRLPAASPVPAVTDQDMDVRQRNEELGRRSTPTNSVSSKSVH